jgi:hypothetical protein
VFDFVQPTGGPEGGVFAGDGRHGSIIPNPGRVRSRNEMLALIGIERHRVGSLNQQRISSAALRQVTRELTDRKFGTWCAVSDLMPLNHLTSFLAAGLLHPVPSPSTGVLSNQGAGESQAGKNEDVMPRQNPAVGSGQNSSGEADIEKSATPLKLTDAQREQIRSYFAGKSANRLQSVDFSVAIGAAVPHKVELQRLPPQISSVIGGYQSDDYLIVGDQLVIVDRSARRVVAIVPNIG